MYTLTTAYSLPTARGGGTNSTPSIAAIDSASGVICSGVAWPTTWMVAIPDAGYCSARVSKNCRSGALGGSNCAPELRSSIRSAGAARMPRMASTPMTTSHGRRCVQRASLEKTPSAGATSPSFADSRRSPGILLSSPGRIILAAGQRQQCRHQGQRHQQRDHHHAHPGGADGAQDPGLEQQQTGQADRHRDAGEQHRAARGGHRRHQSIGAGRPGRSGCAGRRAALRSSSRYRDTISRP